MAEESDLLDFDMHEVGVTRTILQRSRRVFLVAGRSKFHRSATVRIAGLPDLDALVTDRALPEPLAGRCRDHDVEVIVAPAEGGRGPT